MFGTKALTPRALDSLSAANKNGSFIKDVAKFREVNDMKIYGGSGLLGTYIWKSKNTETRKVSFITRHNHREYFAMEILQLLGVNTPKIRFTTDALIASRSIDDYIPMIGLRHDVIVNYESKQIDELRAKYKLDLNKQVVIDLETKQELKMSGETFCAHIFSQLLRDCDFQPEGFNFGLKRVNNRFYCFAIDKDKVSFNGNEYDAFSTDTLLSHCTRDQQLLIANRIYEALAEDKEDHCAFDKIFNNERVLQTPALSEFANTYCRNFKITAQSFLTHCYRKFGENCIMQFKMREAVRAEIAKEIVAHLNLSSIFFDLIMNDLRACYYQHNFSSEGTLSKKNRKNLMNKLIYDLKKELDFTVRADCKLSSSDIFNGKKRKLTVDGNDDMFQSSPKYR